MIIQQIRHDWPENAGCTISRPQGIPVYTFLHFLTPVQIQVGDQLISARPGACIFYAPHTPQYFHAPCPLLHNWMHPAPEFSALLQQYGISEDTLLYPASTGFISELFQQMEAEFFSDNPFKESLSHHLLHTFLIRFSRELQAVGPVSVAPRTREILRGIRQKILSAPAHPWTLEEMAQLSSVSISRFHTLYKAVFGSSPMQDVISARIDRAKALLDQTALPVSTVAELAGYSDQYHFIRQFKSATGQTPGAYRKSRL